MTMERRTVLKSGAAAALLGGPFAGFAAMPAQAREKAAAKALGSTTLVPIADERDEVVRLEPGIY